MLQLLQHQKTGEIIIEEIPAPRCFPNGILVELSHSLISAGTEKNSVDNAKASLLERARRQPDQVKLVIDFIKKEGLFATLERVKAKLDSYKTLGYSAAGVVIESDCDEFKIGDRVAVAGAGYANHSEICAIPKNLAVKLPENVTTEEAAYTTVASIALQGVRQAETQLGENVAVIGLGLIGQITVQLLKANGANVVGFDIDESTFDLAKKLGCQNVFKSSKEFVKEAIFSTNSSGFDSVIITASANSNQPIELAIDLLRKRGKIIVVGAVPMNIPRDNFYRKELELRIATSYGPGRYDPNYEELGYDYPLAFVRWTENRNMQAIIELLSQKKLNFSILTTHKFDIQEANNAYKLISGEVKEKYIGILLYYPQRENKNKSFVQINNKPVNDAKVKVGFIGTGSFAQNYLMPALQKCDVEFIALANSSSLTTMNVAKRFNFREAYSNGLEVIKNDTVDLIFCASQHSSHYYYVSESLKHNKAIYVEKPLAIKQNELDEIAELYSKNNTPIMVGFNRRFSDAFLSIEKFFETRREPMNIIYRVNAGFIPKSSWIQQPEQGGRIIGEVCHFIDTLIFLTKSKPAELYAYNISSSQTELSNNDNLSIIIKFADGSVGTIIYTSAGDSSLPKEYCEIFCQSKVAIMDNFTKVRFYQGGKVKEMNFDGEKGIKREVQTVIQAKKLGKQMPIPFEDIYITTKATFLILDSLKQGKPMNF
ncbi:MAG: bi-domain-containing oxidoreductase [Candidatus Kapaibacteriota bacterium]